MARVISAASLTELGTAFGTEPIIIIEIFWVDGSPPLSYADRDIPGDAILGRIVNLGNLDNVVNISKSSSSQEISIVLDDTDGTIKDIQDVNDVHHREVRVYQWFEGIDVDDKFEIFRGRINSPFTWSEREQTISFNIVSQLEDKEIGFSPEEGEFSSIRDDLIGKPWPMCFGTTINNPGLRLSEVRRGTLADGFAIHDFTIVSHIGAHTIIRKFLLDLAIYWALSAGYLKFIGLDDLGDQAEDNSANLSAQAADREIQIQNLATVLASQKSKERGSVRVVGGSDFPQGTTLTLDIGGATLTGVFIGDTFSIHSGEHPEKKFYGAPNTAVDLGGSFGTISAFGGSDGGTGANSPYGGEAIFNLVFKEYFRAQGFKFKQVDGSGGFIPNGTIVGDAAGEFLAQAGASVSIFSAEPMQYVASITPGTVLRVSAFQSFKSGAEHFVDIDSSRWSAAVVTYGDISATIVTITDALSKTDGFSDEIFITFQSTIGPNTVDVLEYLIDTYTDLTADSTTFDAVRTRLTNYPSHFCINDRKNILTALREISFQARCAIFLSIGKLFLKYLPEVPASIQTVTESDIDAEQSVEVYYTSTEELVTKMVAVWREHGAQKEDNKFILRHNIKKYGTHEREFDWYIYNNRDIVLKAMTFWLIRMANTWKKIRFSTALNLLKLEAFDGATLDLNTNYVADEDVLCIVEKADYDSATNSLKFEIWTPVRVGEMTAFDFAYPFAVDSTLEFPTAVDTAAGFAGGDGLGAGATGGLIGQPRSVNLSVTYSGVEDPFGFGERRYEDKGDPTPSDTGDVTPGSPVISSNPGIGGAISSSPTPVASSQPPKDRAPLSFIDIRETKIVDGDNPGFYATFDSFFERINGVDGRLVMKTTALISDGTEDKEKEFDFKFDDEGTKWGAGTAFLQDN